MPRFLKRFLVTGFAIAALAMLSSTAFAVGRGNGNAPDNPGRPDDPGSNAGAHAPFTPPGPPPTIPPANGSNPTLPAPADVTACVDGDGNLNVAWCAIDGATKYSIDIEASYNLGTACGDATEEFSFGTDGTSIEIPLASFDIDFGSGPVSACSLSVKVKGLNPPQPHHSQNNPFTEADQNPIDPTVVTCPDVDTAITPTCE